MADDEEYTKPTKSGKTHNVLPIWCNEQTMNLNPLILANIQGSSYFKVHLFKLKTYHEVVDEIYYQVKHLEPWERGSRKTAGQTGMCGGVRGVGAGGIVSTAYCLLYKLYTLRLTRKQLNGLLTHTDSPFIRALGFMYVRYTQPPADLFDWYKDYLNDEEPVDPRAGGGQPTTIGAMARHMLTKLDWFSTLFPRIPVPIQKNIEYKLAEFDRQNSNNVRSGGGDREQRLANPPDKYSRGDRNGRRDRDHHKNDRFDRERDVDRDRDNRYDRERDVDRDRDNRHDREREHGRERSERDREFDRDRYERERNRSDRERDRDRDRNRARERSPRDRRYR